MPIRMHIITLKNFFSTGSQELSLFGLMLARNQASVRSIVLFAVLGLLSLHSTWKVGLEAGRWSVLDVLLGCEFDHERWDIDHLLANSDVSLSDHDSSVMDTLGELVSLGNDGLESSEHELINGKTKDVIEGLLVFLHETELDDSSDEGITFELSSWVVLIKSHEFSSSLSELGEGKLDSPHFSLVLEAISTNDFELMGESVLIERLSWGLRSFLVVCVFLWHVSIYTYCSLQ